MDSYLSDCLRVSGIRNRTKEHSRFRYVRDSVWSQSVCGSSEGPAAKAALTFELPIRAAVKQRSETVR